MESKINYVLTITRDGEHASVYVLQDLEEMHEDLLTAKAASDRPLHIMDARRVVITAIGKTTYQPVQIDFDADGLQVYDPYGNLLESRGPLPEPEPPKKKKFSVVRMETWTNEIEVEADDEDEAIAIVEEDVREGGFDVLDGWCMDVSYDIDEIKEGDSK